MIASRPLEILGLAENYDVVAHVAGGGKSGQSGAIRLGLARALSQNDQAVKAVLKTESLLTRDARKVERKKVGYKKARKSSQYSKR